MPKVPEQALGAIVAAAIAAFISLLSLIISKELKISEFRQQWIDALRNDISALIGRTEALLQTAIFDDPAKRKELMWNGIADINELWARIQLRLNPKEQLTKDITATLDELTIVFHESDKAYDGARADRIDNRLVKQTQTLLKQEWLRVRKGEVVYRIALATAAAFMVCVAAWFVAQMWAALRPGQ